MNTYRITGTTNSWIANRHAEFNGKTHIVIEKGLTLKEAQKRLLEMFCEKYDIYCDNWGLARIRRPYETNTRKDGTRSFEYDSRKYEIEEEEQ